MPFLLIFLWMRSISVSRRKRIGWVNNHSRENIKPISACWTFCSRFNLHSSGEALHEILERVCGDLCSFSHKSISDIRHWCQSRRPCVQPAFQFSPKMCSGLEVRALCRTLEFFHTNLGKPCLHGSRFVHRALSCWNRLGPFHSSKKENLKATAYKVNLVNGVLSILWQQFREGTHEWDVQVSTYFWPYIVYLIPAPKTLIQLDSWAELCF